MMHLQSTPEQSGHAPHRRLIAGVTLAVSVALQAGIATPAVAAQSQPGIAFTAKVPLVHERLPFYRLARTAAPTALVQTILGSLGSRPLRAERTNLVSRTQTGVVRASVDTLHGDAEIFPDFAAASAHPAFASRGSLVESAATTVFARADMIPKDATTTKLGNQTPILASAQSRPLTNAPRAAQGTAQTLFTYVNAMRYAHGLPVYGKGSQASVAVGGDGSVRGLVRHWQSATVAGSITPTTTAAQLISSISTQLSPLRSANSRISVDAIVPAYYDGAASFLQPVYAFIATIHGGRVSDDHVVGYVPVGKLIEPLPVIGAARGSAPQGRSVAQLGVQPQTNGTSITLGQYANDDGTMLDMANSYYAGYTANPPWWAPAIVRTQWYWAFPGDYVGTSNSYVNSVNIAYTQPHGDWWENTTNGNNDGFFYINDIGTNGNPGYGAAAGGILSTWIIDSCEVVPSFYDLQVTTGNGYNAFTPWWPVFQGLHRVIGFRTEMLLGMDDMNFQIAYDQAQGADAISAFFTDIAAVNFPYYTDTHLNMDVRYDRGSAIFDSRNAGGSIYDVGAQSASGQLQNVWMGN